MAEAAATPKEPVSEPALPSWDDDQSQEALDAAHEKALTEFNARAQQGEFRGLEKGTIVLVDGNGAITIGKLGESLVAVSERHFQKYKTSFDGVFEFRIG